MHDCMKWSTCPFLLVVLFVVRDGVGADGRRSAFSQWCLGAVHIVADAVRLLGGAGVRIGHGRGRAGRSGALTLTDVSWTGGMQRQESALHQLILQSVNKLLRLQTHREEPAFNNQHFIKVQQHKSVWWRLKGRDETRIRKLISRQRWYSR